MRWVYIKITTERTKQQQQHRNKKPVRPILDFAIQTKMYTHYLLRIFYVDIMRIYENVVGVGGWVRASVCACEQFSVIIL